MKWNAQWIWLEHAKNNPTTSLLVRKAFSWEKLPSFAQLAISANNIYRVYTGMTSDRITIDPEICGGRPCVRGMRITVSQVLRCWRVACLARKC